VSEQYLDGTSAHIRLFSAIHSFSAITQMLCLLSRNITVTAIARKESSFLVFF